MANTPTQQDGAASTKNEAATREQALKIAAQNGAVIDQPVGSLTLPPVRIKTANGEVVFRDYSVSLTPGTQCVTIAEKGHEINTSIKLCPGEKSIRVAGGQGKPASESTTPSSLDSASLPQHSQGTKEMEAAKKPKEQIDNSSDTQMIKATGFSKDEEEEFFAGLRGAGYFEVSKGQFQELLSKNATFEEARTAGAEIESQLSENRKKQDAILEELTLSGASQKTIDPNDSRIAELNDLSKIGKDLSYKLDGTARYITHVLKEAHGQTLQAALDAELPSADTYSKVPAPVEQNGNGQQNGTNSSLSQDKNTHELFTDIANLAMSGAGFSTSSQVDSAISNIKTGQDVESLDMALQTFNQLIKERPEFAQRVDSNAVQELANCFSELPKESRPGNYISVPSETIANLPLAGLGSLTSFEVRTIFNLIKDSANGRTAVDPDSVVNLEDMQNSDAI
jgi:hypothetical protein